MPCLASKKNKLFFGQSLIGILIALAIFSILTQTIFTVVGLLYSLVSFNRARITARHLAQEKMEFLRNLPYDNVGTQGGIPAGPIPQEENIVRNKLSYTIKTTITYVDDPFDSTVPTDLLATDYKRVRVEVSWEGLASSRKSPVVLLSDIAPKGIETTTGGGTLSIVVFDADGDPVPQATVEIIATGTIPPVNLTLQTGSNGRVILPGAPTCVSCYQITVTKTDFSSERTYSTSEVANPSKPHQTIIEGQLTEISFSIDAYSSLNLSTKDSRENNFQALPNTVFTLRGEKTIGTDSSAQPVYKYNEELTTDASGNLVIENLEWDNYEFILDSVSSYDISGTNPLNPIVVLPNTTNSFSVALSSESTNNLLLSFVDSSSVPLASISATLTNGTYNETLTSGISTDPDFGQVFFDSLLAPSYTLQATASGYLDYNSTIDVSGDTQQVIILTPQ